MNQTIILIPARLQASRLPGKPLADIAGEPMIVHVWRRAMEAEAGRVVVCTDAEEIKNAIAKAGGEAVMTRADHASGSDRIHEALSRLDPDGEIEVVVNMQGDLPTLDPKLVTACLAPLRVTLKAGGPHIATIAAEITKPDERTNPNVVKAVGSLMGPTILPDGRTVPARLRALYFTRATAPHGDGPLYHHIGIYAYRRAALERFVSLRPSPLELREKLEQLRALEDGMRIEVALVDTVPLGVDTPHDLDVARRIFAQTAVGPAAHPGSQGTSKP
jgi:3-deoxy-manno-octulosonate cytidylyltransferase (CMP-KDO synthetase)